MWIPENSMNVYTLRNDRYGKIPNTKYQISMCRIFISLFAVVGFWVLSFGFSVSAAYPVLTYRYEHHLFTLNPNTQTGWRGTEEVWLYHGAEIRPPQRFRVDGDAVPPLPADIRKTTRESWNADAIAGSVRRVVAATLDRPAGSVRISRNTEGAVVFDGLGLPGRSVDVQRAAVLTIAALEQGVTDIVLPVIETQPSIVLEDPELVAMGIREVVTVGESNFAHSANARRHNIAVGLAKFNGHVIPQGTTFSFNAVLGPVDGSTGYKKELVILGERTLPDYGGGLCQVSTTAYRGIWEYGFPIVQRKNHSFAVQYYAPQGTDATIYPPNVDIKFVNDSPGALLMQTHVDGDNAYFIYYGTRDDRQSEIIGPYVWNRKSPPPDRFEYTSDIAPGTTRVVGKAVPGMQAAWFRILRSPDGTEVMEPVYSSYEARPNFTQIGVAALQMPSLPPAGEADAGG